MAHPRVCTCCGRKIYFDLHPNESKLTISPKFEKLDSVVGNLMPHDTHQKRRRAPSPDEDGWCLVPEKSRPPMAKNVVKISNHGGMQPIREICIPEYLFSKNGVPNMVNAIEEEKQLIVKLPVVVGGSKNC